VVDVDGATVTLRLRSDDGVHLVSHQAEPIEEVAASLPADSLALAPAPSIEPTVPMLAAYLGVAITRWALCRRKKGARR
jgi:hypothetical protein